jgi:hypothetical protein
MPDQRRPIYEYFNNRTAVADYHILKTCRSFTLKFQIEVTDYRKKYNCGIAEFQLGSNIFFKQLQNCNCGRKTSGACSPLVKIEKFYLTFNVLASRQ